MLNVTDLLVFQVLLRDRAAIIDLVATVLGPLRQARGGAGPLVETSPPISRRVGWRRPRPGGCNLSVRAVTYRLERVKQLTGYDPGEPTQRFTLEAAVLGARLLDWPTQPLQSQS